MDFSPCAFDAEGRARDERTCRAGGPGLGRGGGGGGGGGGGVGGGGGGARYAGRMGDVSGAIALAYRETTDTQNWPYCVDKQLMRNKGVCLSVNKSWGTNVMEVNVKPAKRVERRTLADFKGLSRFLGKTEGGHSLCSEMWGGGEGQGGRGWGRGGVLPSPTD